MELIEEQTPDEIYFNELVELGQIGIQEFGSIELATKRIQFLNSLLKTNPGLIRFISDEKNVNMAMKMLKPFM